MSLKNKIFESVNKTLNQVKAIIRKDGGADKPFCVYSETTGKGFGCYSSRKLAEERLADIHKFSSK